MVHKVNDDSTCRNELCASLFPLSED